MLKRKCCIGQSFLYAILNLLGGLLQLHLPERFDYRFGFFQRCKFAFLCMNRLEHLCYEFYLGTGNHREYIAVKMHHTALIINVPVFINEKGQYNRVFFDTNKIATVFGRDNFFEYIQREVKKGNLVRIKNRSTFVSERTSDIDAGYNKNASNYSISQPTKNSQEKFSDRDSDAEDVKSSDSDYSYEKLTSKPDMNITILDSTYPNSRADIIHQAKKNAASVGKRNKDGSVSVYVDDLSSDVIIGTNALKHSLDRRLNINAPVMLKIEEILKNSVKVNELMPRSENIKSTYALIGAAKNINSEIYVVSFIVNSFTNELDTVDVLYSANAKKEPAVLNAPRVSTPAAGSNISISDLLDFVNEYFPDVLPEEVLKHYGHSSRPEGVIGESALFSDRDISNRELLANALDTTIDTSTQAGQNEARKLAEYKSKIAELDKLQEHLTEVKAELKDLTFSKCNR